MRLRITLALAVFLVSQTAFAVITFDQLADDIFVVSHRVKGIGSRGQAMRLVYDKTASLCVAAGFEYYAILDQESQATQENESANASIRVQFFQGDAHRPPSPVVASIGSILSTRRAETIALSRPSTSRITHQASTAATSKLSLMSPSWA